MWSLWCKIIKIFFLLDYGFNWVVALSAIIGVVLAILRFLTSVFPLKPGDVFATETNDDEESQDTELLDVLDV